MYCHYLFIINKIPQHKNDILGEVMIFSDLKIGNNPCSTKVFSKILPGSLAPASHIPKMFT